MRLNIFSGALLHAEHGSHGGIADLLADSLGRAGEFIDEVLIHGIIDSLTLLPFLFLTYLLMEFIEHKASDKTARLMKKTGDLGPAVGGLLGAVPQCGFSAAAANLYTARVISLGALVSVFLSTSDEMLPMLIAGNVKISAILSIVIYKIAVGMLVGFAIDLAIKLMHKEKEEINIDEICEGDNCHCERGIFYSAVHHTLSVFLFVLIVTVFVNALIFFVGAERLASLTAGIPVLSHLCCALIGLIPNCAVSVALTKLAVSGIISVGAMMSGLFSGAGVGLIVLFRMNKRRKENLIIIGILVSAGTVFGLLSELLLFLSL